MIENLLKPSNIVFTKEREAYLSEDPGPPWKLKLAININAGDVCTRPSDIDAAEMDLLGEGFLLELDRDLVAEEARRDGDQKSKSFWSIQIEVSLITMCQQLKHFCE